MENPNNIFKDWFTQHSLNHKKFADNAFVLSTIYNNKPNSRYVCLAKYEENGYYFVTKLESQKYKELSVNNNVSALFYFPDICSTIKITGIAVIVDDNNIRQEMFDNLVMNNKAKINMIAYDVAKLDINNFNEEVKSIKKIYLNKYFDKKILVPNNYIVYKIIPSEFEFNIPSTANKSNLIKVMYFEDNQWKIKKHKQSNCIYLK
jgi:pyridoxine/pyridoxamine 5'-phosphate oxidase